MPTIVISPLLLLCQKRWGGKKKAVQNRSTFTAGNDLNSWNLKANFQHSFTYWIVSDIHSCEIVEENLLMGEKDTFIKWVKKEKHLNGVGGGNESRLELNTTSAPKGKHSMGEL